MLCRWAEKKYGLHEVTGVEFDMRDDGAWSEYTPSDGPYMEVTIKWRSEKSGAQTYTKKDTYYDAALIREILAFGLEGKAS